MALESEWNALALRFQTPLLRHEWFAACLEAFGEGRELSLFVVRASERANARAIAPFLVDRRAPVPMLTLLGNETFEPAAFIYDDPAALEPLVSALKAQRLPAVVLRLCNEAPELALLRAGKTRGVRVFRSNSDNATASVPLACDWPSFEARMSSGSRGYIRRKRKLAEREGALRFDIVVPNEHNIDEQFAEFVRVEGAGWKSRQGTSLMHDVRMLRFYTRYARDAARRGMLRLFFLRIGGATAAARLAVEWGGRLWELKIGYDERFAKCSPGILLTHETLRYACEHGLAAHEFLGGADEWQRWWPTVLHQYTNVRLYPLSVAGGLALCDYTARVFAHRLSGLVRLPLQQLRKMGKAKPSRR